MTHYWIKIIHRYFLNKARLFLIIQWQTQINRVLKNHFKKIITKSIFKNLYKILKTLIIMPSNSKNSNNNHNNTNKTLNMKFRPKFNKLSMNHLVGSQRKTIHNNSLTEEFNLNNNNNNNNVINKMR